MTQHLLLVGGTRADRECAALAKEDALAVRPAAIVVLDAAALPFMRPAASRLPVARPRLLRLAELHQAFPNAQTSGTRLVLTQSVYLVQKWLDAIEQRDLIVATADRELLERGAPEAFQKRGPWKSFDVVDLDRVRSADAKNAEAGHVWPSASPASSASESSLLARAYRTTSSDERLRLCREGVAAAPDSAAAALALASVCRERQDLGGARAALDAAIRLAPDWEAVHYEDGKFWLGCEDMIRARDAFQRAGDLMPNFSAAFSNLGATLGELDEPEAALAAFTQALSADPDSFTILNNIGVVNRELGRLADSEAACRRVVEIAPRFVFGYYNLGHALFLAGRYEASLAAYEEGQRRDPEKNRRQACRLAIVRFANGDVLGAERDLWRAADTAPPEEREDLLLEAYEIAQALLRTRPELQVHQAFVTRIASDIRGS